MSNLEIFSHFIYTPNAHLYLRESGCSLENISSLAPQESQGNSLLSLLPSYDRTALVWGVRTSCACKLDKICKENKT